MTKSKCHSHENGNPEYKRKYGSPIKDFGDDSCMEFGDDRGVDFRNNNEKEEVIY